MSPTPGNYTTGMIKQDAVSLSVAVRTALPSPDGAKDWGVMTLEHGGHYANWEEVQNWADMVSVVEEGS